MSDEQLERNHERYHAACHAIQTGVAVDHANGSGDGTPKHLRVGIATSKVAEAAIARLLIARGIFTLEEYVEAQADEAEIEVRRYEERLGVNLA